MFDAVPNEWRVVELAELATIKTGKTPSTKEPAYWGGDVPFVTPSDMIDAPYLNGVERSLSNAGAAASTVAPAGAVLFTCIASIGKSCILAEQSAFNQQINACIPKLDVDAYFLFSALKARTDHLKDMAGTTAVPIINKSAFGATAISIPPLEEQRRIAEVLRSIDEAIAAGAAAADQAKEARAHQLGTLMALPGLMRPIEDVCRLSGGFGFPMKFQGKRKGSYPFAKVSDMNRPGNEIELVDAENYVDEDDLRLLKAKPFPAGATLFPKVGAALLTNKRRIAAREFIVDNNVMGAVATGVDPWFLFYAFNTIDMADYVQPGAVPSINQRTIGKIMIPVPNADVQHAFVEAMRDLDHAIKSQLATLTRLLAAKDAVAADLLSGRVRVPA